MVCPNIIFIVLDTLRTDRVLATYENKMLTPYIEKLLNNSIYFENCISNYSWTLPSHNAIFSGLYQTQNKLLTKDLDIISNKIPVLTEILKDMGFFTMCFTENMWIRKKYGLTRGFNIIFNNLIKVFVLTDKSEMSNFIKYLKIVDLKLKKSIRSKIFLKFIKRFIEKIENLYYRIRNKLFWKKILFENNYSIKDLTQFTQILKDNINKKPFYLFFNIMATHCPYIPINEVIKLFNIHIKDIKVVKDFLVNPIKYIYMLSEKSEHLSQKKIKIIKKLYNACVFYSDLIVEKIISMLNNLDLFEKSYIIITSDHGEYLCDHLDHYLCNHGNFHGMYESVIRVPLIIYNPNLKKKIVKKQVELKDLFHTILHLTGNTGDKNKYLDIKKSILYQIENDSTPKYIFGEHLKSNEKIFKIFKTYKRFLNKGLIPKLNSNIYFLRSNIYKYIRYTIGIEEFYDLSTDPYEQINIKDKNNDSFKKMKLYMNDYLKKIKNINELKNMLTEQEKDKLKKNIRKIKGI